MHFGEKTVGNVRVIRQGLYYRFQCRCQLSGEVVCRVAVQCGNTRENLGVLTPVDGGFGLETSLAVKKLEPVTPEFRVLPSRPGAGGKFAPIFPEEPFGYIQRLKDAFLAERDGVMGAEWHDR